MLIVERIIGRADSPEFAGRRTDLLVIGAADAGRRRMRLHSASGAEIGIDFPRQSWLFDGAVLHDDGERVVVVARRREPVMVIAMAPMTAEAAFRIGHALGNRHSPSEWHGNEVVVPVTDTPELTSRPILALGLPGLELRFEERAFAADGPPACAGAPHEHHAYVEHLAESPDPGQHPHHQGHHHVHRHPGRDTSPHGG